MSATGAVAWMYRMVPGTCSDSLALVVAEMFGLPPSVLARACQQELGFAKLQLADGRPSPHHSSDTHKHTLHLAQPALQLYLSALPMPGLSASRLLLALAGSLLVSSNPVF